MSHLNCHNSKVALDELAKIRPRDDVLLTSECPMANERPTDLRGYISIHEDLGARVCAYVREGPAASAIIETETHAEKVTLKLTGGRQLTCSYIRPGNDLPPPHNDFMADGEIRMGDYNAPHPEWTDDPGTHRSARGNLLVNWAIATDARERGPPGPTHDRGNKLDLVFTKDTPTMWTTIHHNGKIEHSDHDCQSISILLPAPPNAHESKPDYRKMDHQMMVDFFKRTARPATPQQLDDLLQQAIQKVPRKRSANQARLNPDVLEARRAVRREGRKNPGSDNH